MVLCAWRCTNSTLKTGWIPDQPTTSDYKSECRFEGEFQMHWGKEIGILIATSVLMSCIILTRVDGSVLDGDIVENSGLCERGGGGRRKRRVEVLQQSSCKFKVESLQNLSTHISACHADHWGGYHYQLPLPLKMGST